MRWRQREVEVVDDVVVVVVVWDPRVQSSVLAVARCPLPAARLPLPGSGLGSRVSGRGSGLLQHLGEQL